MPAAPDIVLPVCDPTADPRTRALSGCGASGAVPGETPAAPEALPVGVLMGVMPEADVLPELLREPLPTDDEAPMPAEAEPAPIELEALTELAGSRELPVPELPEKGFPG